MSRASIEVVEPRADGSRLMRSVTQHAPSGGTSAIHKNVGGEESAEYHRSMDLSEVVHTRCRR